MSRRSRRRRQVNTRAERDASVSLTDRLHRPLFTPTILDLRDVEDRRTFHPLGDFRPARATSGHPVKPHVVKPAKSSRALSYRINFAVPKRTVICVRRQTRKEVLHALRKVGRGRGGGHKRFNWQSEVSC